MGGKKYILGLRFLTMMFVFMWKELGVDWEERWFGIRLLSSGFEIWMGGWTKQVKDTHKSFNWLFATNENAGV